MNSVPGFTAEASLFKTSERYPLTAAWGARSRGLIPQQDFPVPPFPDPGCTPCTGGRQICWVTRPCFPPGPIPPVQDLIPCTPCIGGRQVCWVTRPCLPPGPLPPIPLQVM